MSAPARSLCLVGPPASGKTSQILRYLEECASADPHSVLLLVPTATLAEHLQHEAARRHWPLRPSSITTLHGFASRQSPGLRPVPAGVLAVLLARLLRQTASGPLQAFQKVAQYAGFRAQLAAVIEELALAGCEPEALQASLASAPAEHAPVLTAVAWLYGQIEQRLQEKGLALRGRLLRRVADEIRSSGLGPVRTVLLDGFFTFSPAELEFLGALAEVARVVVTLPAWDGAEPARERLRDLGFDEQQLGPRDGEASLTIVQARGRVQEAAEVAARIQEHIAQGRQYRELGVVVRAGEPYLHLLLRSFERFGIPVRAYFREPLADHPVLELLRLGVHAARAGCSWDAVAELAGLTPGAPADDFEYELLKKLPADLLADEQLRPPHRVRDLLAQFQQWRQQPSQPAALWNRGLGAIARNLLVAQVADEASFQQARAWASYGAAWTALREVAGELDLALGDEALSFEEYWEALWGAAATETFRAPDRRRNVVHLMDAYEARQWRLPVVFVCGLVEGEFPRHIMEDPVLKDDARKWLTERGWRLRTREDREREEEFLFEVMLKRADECLVLSYPLQDDAGRPLVPAFRLRELEQASGSEQARDAIPAPARETIASSTASAVSVPPTSLRDKHRQISATQLEDYLQCPFLFFARHSLELEPMPSLPAERFDYSVQGWLVHEVLKQVVEKGRDKDLEDVIEECFTELQARQHIPRSYRTELVLEELKVNLRRFIEKYLDTGGRLNLQDWPRAGEIRCEQDFQVPFGDLTITGRLDRLDVTENPGQVPEAWIVDYKYASKASLQQYRSDYERGLRLQAGLYAKAVEEVWKQRVEGVALVSVRAAEAKPVSWCGREEVQDLIRATEERLPEVLEDLFSGNIKPEPADPKRCEVCEFRDICRVEQAQPKVLVAGGTE